MDSSFLLILHSYLRWLVLISLLTAIYRACRGYATGSAFSARDNSIRHWTATIAHIQVALGMLVYFRSPLVSYFLKNLGAGKNLELLFFGMIHGVLMLSAIVVLSMGSAFSKRKGSDREKFRTMLIWYTIALLLILIAIPWPFSPLAQRPLFR